MYRSLPPAAQHLRWTLANTNKAPIVHSWILLYKSLPQRFWAPLHPSIRLPIGGGERTPPGTRTLNNSERTGSLSQSRRDDCSGFHLIHLLAFVRLCAELVATGVEVEVVRSAKHQNQNQKPEMGLHQTTGEPPPHAGELLRLSQRVRRYNAIPRHLSILARQHRLEPATDAAHEAT
ncbi:hypothetical protein BGZ61DRAFT_73159 [Ilyonectria robusta]|uniref:uncharacterized protein n=1 Tax=Ilyonectria robusta TaxID=1079257 RepID=UPI001E8E0DB7|nr:uncharacterized protein BGZ61DRAFT_73159 [Ilyonectria robusta]KAH8676994.1 hypothetical protein BGZ61DRAFT_73159 [Ilyonectria robusta]